MIEICCGALGAMAVLGAFLAGFAEGRKAQAAPVMERAPREASEEEKCRLREEQSAFEHMLRYNRDTAYGLGEGFGVGGEEQ